MDTLYNFLHQVNVYLLNPFIGLMLAVAFVVFLWGVAQYVGKGSEAAAREEGTRHIIWGLVGLFIMIGAFGIIHIILATIAPLGPATPGVDKVIPSQ